MTHHPMTRRVFLASSAAVAATIAASEFSVSASAAESSPEIRGVVAALTTRDGLAPGSCETPSAGTVTLLDGRTLPVHHTTPWRIGPGKSVLIGSQGRGAWSVLYAEV